MDRFALYHSINISETDESSISTSKNFLEKKFLISFKQINEEITNSTLKENIIDIIYSTVYKASYGYSLGQLIEYTYLEYTKHIFYGSPHTIKSCEKQIKYHCIISALYTIASLERKEHYSSLPEVASKYSSKKYFTFDSYGFKKDLQYEGYCGDNNIFGNKLRKNFDKLYFTSSQYFFASKDIQTHLCNYLHNSVDIKKTISSFKEKNTPGQKRKINDFLDEFTYDLIINSMRNGADLNSKMLNIRQNSTDTSTRRKYIRKFVQDLSIIDTNFNPSHLYEDKTNSLLYYWKKESLFRIENIKTLTNLTENTETKPFGKLAKIFSEFPTMLSMAPFKTLFLESLSNENISNTKFLIEYLSEITIPVITHTFFISLCEYFEYSLNDMKNFLEKYINSSDITTDSFNEVFILENVRVKRADILGECISYIFDSNQILTLFDKSFPTPVGNFDYDNLNLVYTQADISINYYINFIRNFFN